MKFERKTNDIVKIVGDVAHIDVSTEKYPYRVALIDVWDIPLVIDGLGRWAVSKLSSTATSLYVRRNTPGGGQLLHRFLLGLTTSKPEVDHENLNGLDNRRLNIRRATEAQNRANRPPRKGKVTSQYKGVHLKNDCNRWVAKVGGEWLGYHPTEIDAARAYDRGAVRRYGKFAFLNFPEEHHGV